MSKTEFQESFRRLSGQTQMPGLHEGVKDQAYKDGMKAGQAVANVIQMGWANRPANDSLAAWMKIVDKYVGEEFKEFINDPQWLKGFQSALIGHYGKSMKIEWVVPVARAIAQGAMAAAKSPAGRAALASAGQYAAKVVGRAVSQKVDAAQLSPDKFHAEHGKCPPGYRRNKADTKCLPAKTESRMEEGDMTVANTIVKQMGGAGRLKAMIGANTFVGSDNSVTFRWPSKKPSTGNAVKITLDASDTYTVEFMQVGKGGSKTVKKMDGIYADDLKDIFEKQTGLYLTMSARVEGELLDEASEVESRDALPMYAQHNAKRIEKMFGAKYSTAWSGVNGIILEFSLGSVPRIVKGTLKDLADMPDFRWVEFTDDSITVGC